MQKIIKIVKREFLSKVMTKGFLIATVLGPILMIGLLLGPAYFMSLSSENVINSPIADYTSSLMAIYIKLFLIL